MKGLKHNVIEINDTDNTNIEKILVFLKPQAEQVSLVATREQATRLLKELDVKKVSEKKFGKAFFYIVAAISVLFLMLLLILL